MGIRDTTPSALQQVAMTPAEQLIADIVGDLSDRRGLSEEYWAIDDETRAEIVASWETIAQKYLTPAPAVPARRCEERSPRGDQCDKPAGHEGQHEHTEVLGG